MSIHLGTIELTRKPIEDFTGATLLSGFRAAVEPDKSFIRLSALQIATKGPRDWPSYRAGEAYASHGQRVRAYLAVHAPLEQALALGQMVINSIAQEPGVTDEQVEEYAAFFGVTLSGSDDSDSPSDTRDPPSED